MVKRNPFFGNFKENYLFPEIAKRKRELIAREPNARVISLGIGDTTEPIPEPILNGLREKVENLGSREKYTGYGSGEGNSRLRALISERLYNGLVDPDEIFISDGSKPDIGRLQVLFGSHASIALQDPTYPVYLFTAIALGQCAPDNVITLPCTAENGFFPDLDNAPRTDLIFFCSPNNPTGAIPSRAQCEKLVACAKANRSIIIFDSAYSGYIRDESLLKTLYEIPGAKEVVLETGSFSKLAGFTGVRLGWTVVPKQLQFEDGSSVHEDWSRVTNTFFNGACNISEAGGIAALSDEGIAACRQLTDFYLENGQILARALTEIGHPPIGGDNAPYLWIPFPGRQSWEMFSLLLNELHLVTTPGAGFGRAGEGFIRMSAFGHRSDIEEAAKRIVSARAMM